MARLHFFLLVCWASWASFVNSSPSYRLESRQAPPPPSAALPGAPGPAPVVPAGPAAAEKSSTPSQEAAPPAPPAPDYQGKEPCAVVSEMIQPQLPKNASAADAAAAPLPTLPAQMAWDCLQSVPLNKSAALALMDSIQPFLKWQSTTAYLKNPPDEYREKIQEATDVMGNVEDIINNLNNDKYANEFAFGWDLYQVTARTHDGHFVYIPDSVGFVFAWSRTVPLVSVSEDGEKLPVPFAYQDVLQASFDNSTYEPSRITKINGKDAIQFLEDESQIGSLQDRDALYNNMFYELAQISLGGSGAGRGMFAGGGSGRFNYPGPDTVMEFANGTTKRYPNIARAVQNLTGVTDGPSLYKTYFQPPLADLTVDLVNSPTITPGATPTPTGTNTTSTTISTPTETPTPVPAPGFPTPQFRSIENLNGGYYIDAPGYEDVAVLNIASFVGDALEENDFQDVNTNFLQKAKADGKTKLVIDVSANGGGTILQGYDIFKQLFPQMEPYGASRFRAHEAANMVGDIFSAAAAPFPRDLNLSNDNIINVIASPFNFRQDINQQGGKFDDWDNKFNQRSYNNDNYTGIIRWDLTDPLTLINSGGINVTGFGNRTGFTQPFEAQNIVMVYDGYCASTCTIFSEMMRQQAGVKAIAFGGRSNSRMIQAVGGVKGSNNFPWTNIQSIAETAFNFSSKEDRQRIASTELGRFNNYLPFYRAAGSPNVNVRDALRMGDESGEPLQFRYEPADCRIFYTAEMTIDVTAMWKAAADSMWGSRNRCVAGGLRQGTIGQMETLKAKNGKKEKEKRAKAMTSKVVTKTKLEMAQYKQLMVGFDVFTDQMSRFKNAQGLMLP